MKHQETIAGRIVRNVNRVLEVIPRTINSDAEVIRLNFQKPRKAKRKRASGLKRAVKTAKRSGTVAAKKIARAGLRAKKRGVAAVSRRATKTKKRVKARKVRAQKRSVSRPMARAA